MNLKHSIRPTIYQIFILAVEIISNLKKHSAPGGDGVKSCVVKYLIDLLPPIVSKIININLSNGDLRKS